MVREYARRRTRVSLRVAIAVASALALLGQTAPAPVLAVGNAGLHLTKTVDPTQVTVNPALGLTLGVDKASAIPGDTLTYTAVVTNAFSTFGVGGTFRAVSLGNADGTVAYYWDELQSCVLGCGDGTDAGNVHWIAFAGFVAGQAGDVPVMKPDVATGLNLTATGVPGDKAGEGDPVDVPRIRAVAAAQDAGLELVPVISDRAVCIAERHCPERPPYAEGREGVGDDRRVGERVAGDGRGLVDAEGEPEGGVDGDLGGVDGLGAVAAGVADGQGGRGRGLPKEGERGGDGDGDPNRHPC